MRRLSLVIVSVILMTGCSSGGGSDQDPDSGSDGSTSATRSPGDADPSESAEPTAKAATGPECSTIWQEGKTLPVDYLTCRDGDVAGESDVVECEDGTQLITYVNEFFARSGQKIIKPVDAPLQDTPEFSAAYSACTGE